MNPLSRTAGRRRQTSSSPSPSINGIDERAFAPRLCIREAFRPNLARYMDPTQLQSMIDQINKQLAAEGKGPFQWKTIPQGAATSVWAAALLPLTRLVGVTARTAT